MFPPAKKLKKKQSKKLNRSSIALYNALNVQAAPQGPTPLSSVSQGHGSHLAMLLNKDVPFRPAGFTPIIPSKSLQAKRENRAILEEAMQEDPTEEFFQGPINTSSNGNVFPAPAAPYQPVMPAPRVPMNAVAPINSFSNNMNVNVNKGGHLASLLTGQAQPRPANFTPIVPSKSNQARRANNAMFQQVQELEKMAKQLERAAKEARLDAKRAKKQQQGQRMQAKHLMMWGPRVPVSIKTQEMIFDDVSSVTASVRSS